MFVRTIPEGSLVELLSGYSNVPLPAACDRGAGTIRERIKLLELQFGSPYENRYISPEPALGHQQV